MPHNGIIMKDLIVTLTGPDTTGIVARLAAIAEKHGGNWLDSRMMRMGGHFSGILRLAMPEDTLEAFTSEVAAFMQETGYQFTLQPDDRVVEVNEGRTTLLELSGQDHPGIVHAIFTVFQKTGVNVEELHTGLSIAPWSGTPLFEAKAILRLPEGLSLDDLHQDLEALSADLLVDLEFKEK